MSLGVVARSGSGSRLPCLQALIRWPRPADPAGFGQAGARYLDVGVVCVQAHQAGAHAAGAGCRVIGLPRELL
jgi:hypothetical protein